MYEIVVETGEVEVGTYTVDADGELSNLYLVMLFNGVPSFVNETIYLRVVRSTFTGTPVQSSNVTVASVISGSQSWIGNVRFDFNKETLTSGETIQVFLGTGSYTRGSTEIGAILNYLDSAGSSFEVLANKGSYLTLFNNR